LKRPDLSTTRGKLKVLILVTGLLVIAGAATTGAIVASSSPTFCASCHEMKPEFATWQVSSHKEVTCIQCHVGPGIMNLLKDKVEGIEKVAWHLSGSYTRPIEMAKPMENGQCLTCHPREGLKNNKGELAVPHGKHLDQDVNCLSCHQGLVHGNISERGVNIAANDHLWDIAKAQEEIKPQFSQLSMKECMVCHESRELDIGCTKCHSSFTQDYKLAPS